MTREALVIAEDDRRIRSRRGAIFQATPECETGVHHDTALTRKCEVCSHMSLERLEAVFSGAEAGIWAWLRSQVTGAVILGAGSNPGTLTKPDELRALTRYDSLRVHTNFTVKLELPFLSFSGSMCYCVCYVTAMPCFRKVLTCRTTLLCRRKHMSQELFVVILARWFDVSSPPCYSCVWNPLDHPPIFAIAYWTHG